MPLLASAPGSAEPAALRTSLRERAPRLAIAALMLIAGVALLLNNLAFRSLEASLTSWILAPVVRTPLAPSMDRFFVWVSPEHLVAIRVTVECTALVIGLPLTLLAIACLAATRVRWQRVAFGTAVMWVAVMLTNTIRLGVIGWSTQVWGVNPGYTISHTVVGSAIGVLGFTAGAAVLFLSMGFRGRRRSRRP